MWYVIGLGNPGEEYEDTRHNVGRDVVRALGKSIGVDFKEDAKSRAHIGKGKLGGKLVVLVLPDLQMNLAGKVVGAFIKNKKEAKNLVVVRDDIDMGQGVMKIVFNRGTGGHRGGDSIVRAVKTSEFFQLKIGVLPLTPSGKTKKPKGEKAVISFILSEWKPAEEKIIKKEIKRAGECLETLLKDGFPKAATEYNG